MYRRVETVGHRRIIGTNDLLKKQKNNEKIENVMSHVPYPLTRLFDVCVCVCVCVCGAVETLRLLHTTRLWLHHNHTFIYG